MALLNSAGLELGTTEQIKMYTIFRDAGVFACIS